MRTGEKGGISVGTTIRLKGDTYLYIHALLALTTRATYIHNATPRPDTPPSMMRQTRVPGSTMAFDNEPVDPVYEGEEEHDDRKSDATAATLWQLGPLLGGMAVPPDSSLWPYLEGLWFLNYTLLLPRRPSLRIFRMVGGPFRALCSILRPSNWRRGTYIWETVPLNAPVTPYPVSYTHLTLPTTSRV